MQKLPRKDELDSVRKQAALPSLAMNKGNVYAEKLMDSRDNSFSSINFEEEAHDVTNSCRDMLQAELAQSPVCEQLMASRILGDISLVHVRKTRKQLLSEISFESETHNIYAPRFDSSLESNNGSEPGEASGM